MQNNPMAQDHLNAFEEALISHRCVFQRREFDWVADLDNGGSVSLPVPWRIISEGRIAFADKDDGQKFGLPACLDGEVLVNKLLVGRTIIRAKVDRQTADLTVYFEENRRLDVFNYSAGYEGWEARIPSEGRNMWIIALGGGDVAIHF